MRYSSDIIVFMVFFAAVVVLFFDLFVIVTSKNENDKRETFNQVVAAAGSSVRNLPGQASITDDIRFEFHVQLAFLRTLGRFPTPEEQTSYVKILMSHNANTGSSDGKDGGVENPVDKVSDILRNTLEYKKVHEGNVFASEDMTQAASVRQFADSSDGLAISPIQKEGVRSKIYLTIIDVFTRNMRRSPSINEINDIYVKLTDRSNTNIILIPKRVLRQRIQEIVKEKHETEDPWDLEGSYMESTPYGFTHEKGERARRVYGMSSLDHAIDSAHSYVYGVSTPAYDRALIRERVPRRSDDPEQYEQDVIAYLESLRDSARDIDRTNIKGTAKSFTTFNEIDNLGNSFANPVNLTPDSEISMIEKSLRVAEEKESSDRIRRCSPSDSVGKRIQERNMFIAELDDRIP